VNEVLSSPHGLCFVLPIEIEVDELRPTLPAYRPVLSAGFNVSLQPQSISHINLTENGKQENKEKCHCQSWKSS
jgi:hypothetical protein